MKTAAERTKRTREESAEEYEVRHWSEGRRNRFGPLPGSVPCWHLLSPVSQIERRPGAKVNCEDSGERRRTVKTLEP